VAVVDPSSRIPRLLTSKRHVDERGWFMETFSERRLTEVGITTRFVQDNHSMSKRRGTIRGLHFQLPPMDQTKLVRVLRGRIFDVAIDIRRGSPTFGRFVTAELSADDGGQFFIPSGFAHGFCTLVDDTEVLYKVSNYYAPEHEGGIRWNDPAIAAAWPLNRAEEAVVSAKDAALPLLEQLRSPFVYDGVPLAVVELGN
jgi:dTDP-4-dehydrorhamnose 3,5-epimerase